jgi:uncharacterized iron-regulated protein
VSNRPCSKLVRWGSLALSGLLVMTACAHAELPQDVTPAPEAEPTANTAEDPVSLSLQPLLDADVVYLGERHDSAADHAAQLKIIQRLQAENAQVAIALEMFQRPFQPVIDRYLAGEITEADLVAQTEYEQRWGFPWEFYAPILRLAQEQGLPVLALNAPSEVVRQVARQGLDSLEGDDFRYIPPLDQIDTTNEAYQAFVFSAFGAHGAHGHMDFDNFFAAQVLWDETMAETIAAFRQDNPDYQVVVLAGQGHVVYGYGIPERVSRRLGSALNQQIVLLNPPEAATEEEAIADQFWYSQD